MGEAFAQAARNPASQSTTQPSMSSRMVGAERQRPPRRKREPLGGVRSEAHTAFMSPERERERRALGKRLDRSFASMQSRPAWGVGDVGAPEAGSFHFTIGASAPSSLSSRSAGSPAGVQPTAGSGGAQRSP